MFGLIGLRFRASTEWARIDSGRAEPDTEKNVSIRGNDALGPALGTGLGRYTRPLGSALVPGSLRNQDGEFVRSDVLKGSDRLL